MALNVIWLDDPASGKRELVGGKAANLNQLHSGGQVFRSGFCITTECHGESGAGAKVAKHRCLPTFMRRSKLRTRN